ncbi:hypothetical protein MTR_0012s0170 [Medicago truncatula]|uniref:Uncharacterized protein n=1 Tax=Medicago truncatula TaxID=3880 RepID=G7ZYB9_MEDTR|nr:hypothetical protein MTR_0012s0170 [Medicago truncatula]
MRKIQAANQNQPHVNHLLTNNFLSPRYAASRASVDACVTRAIFHQTRCDAWHCVQASTMFNEFNISLLQLIPQHHSTHHWTCSTC